MEKLIERIAKAPLGAKIGVVAGALVLVTALNYFVMALPFGDSVSAVETKIKKVAKDQEQLDRDFIEKTAIANDLNRFRKEKELLERRLDEALAELPEQKNIDELLQLFQDRAQKAGLEINTITPQPEKAEGFYARIPIDMTVTGNFHEIATFFDALGRLRRIVNIGQIAMDSPKDVKGRLVVNAKFVLTTFMFVDQKAAAPATGKGKKGGAK
jgi:type IV pilus assembly protein PilO